MAAPKKPKTHMRLATKKTSAYRCSAMAVFICIMAFASLPQLTNAIYNNYFNCAAGTERRDDTATCYACLPGTYKTTTGTHFCTNCASCNAGSYRDCTATSPGTQCKPCPPATYKTGSSGLPCTACSTCSIGNEPSTQCTATANSGTCRPCGNGKFKNVAGKLQFLTFLLKNHIIVRGRGSQITLHAGIASRAIRVGF